MRKSEEDKLDVANDIRSETGVRIFRYKLPVMSLRFINFERKQHIAAPSENTTRRRAVEGSHPKGFPNHVT